MTDARGVCAASAAGLAPEVPYVRGWAEARRAAEALAEQLQVLDVGHVFAGLRADVNVNGDGVVQLGEVRPAAAQLLARLITNGLTVEALRRHSPAEQDEPTAGDALPHPTP